MPKLKMFILILVMCLISGCSAEYNLIVTSNFGVREKVKLYVVNDELRLGDITIKEYLKHQVEVYKNMPEYKHYNFNYKVGSEVSYIQLEYIYPTMDNYHESIGYKLLFEDFVFLKHEETVTFQTYGHYLYNNLYDESPDPFFVMRDVDITVRLHNKILESNADFTDERNNTLTWQITNKDLTKNIYFKVGKEKRYDIILIDMILYHKNVIIPVGGTTIILLGIGCYGYRKYKKNNKI